VSSKSKKKPSKSSKRTDGFILRPFLWLSTGFFIGICVPWYFYLQFVVNSLFVEYNWAIPSSIYARELNLYNNKNISPKAITYELLQLGYKESASIKSVGSFTHINNTFKIHTKGFKFFDGLEKSKVVQFDYFNSRIQNTSAPLIRLEPLLIGQFYSSNFENRQPIPITQVPNTMVMGLQAIEDRNFNQHFGVDVFGVIRAVIRNILSGKIVQGGSTITQQLIKNRLNYNNKSWLRKINEAIAALMLERKFDKGAIIENYFNEIYWGQKGSIAIHGIKQASHYYFSKSPSQLSISEQALLIGIIKGPSWYHPIKHKQRAIKRRNIVLNSWYQTSVISKKQWLLAKKASLNIHLNTAFTDSNYRDFLSLVKQQLNESIKSQDLNTKGLRIFTTLNPFIQQQLATTLETTTDSLAKNVQSAALVSNASTGEVLAIKGDKNKTSYYNRALLSKRQIGSLIKPFVYLAALEQLPGFTLSTLIADSPIKVKLKQGEYWQPKNYDGKSLGQIPAQMALIKSRNQATVNLGLQLGVSGFVNYLKKFGLNIVRSKHPSVFLGATELTPYEVSKLYLTIASNNTANQLISIRQVVDKNNKLIRQTKHSKSIQIKARALSQIRETLHQVTVNGTAAKLSYHYGFSDLYGKTGTTNQGKNSWFVGFNKDYLATFWVGKDNNTSTHLTGSSGALILWADWFDKID
jgi:penicillin-binding protein 1B